MKLVLMGLSHHTAPVALRERMAVDDVQPCLHKLRASDEIDEAVLVSTCNRTEVIALTRNLEAARLRLRSLFRRELGGGMGASEQELAAHFYEHRDGDAMRHVLRVASALDSMVVGEPQILGQTKEAYKSAVECGVSGPILDRLFQRAFATAKRVRNETGIAARPVSVARVAANLASQIFEDLAGKNALMVGAGEMIELALSALRDAGLEDVCVANRTAERAAALAVAHGGSAHGLDELPALLRRSDVVLTCIGVHRPILTPELVAQSLRARRGRPMFVIDIGVPRNVDPAIDALDAVFAFTGNKFEVRAVGASANCAELMTALNTAVAAQLSDFKKQVDALIRAEKLKKDEAIFNVLRDAVIASKHILFEGDGYSSDWEAQAEKRALSNFKTTPEALKAALNPRVIELFETSDVLSEVELRARHEIKLHKYSMTLQIEAQTLADMARNHIVPTAIAYQNLLLENVGALKTLYGAGVKDKAKAQLALIEKLSEHVDVISQRTDELIRAYTEAKHIVDSQAQAEAYCNAVRPIFDEIRSHVDDLEMAVDDGLWPITKYRELLFTR